MKATDFLSALVFFFNDFIGAIIPGLLLIGGWSFLFGTPEILTTTLSEQSGLALLLLIVGAFTAGHGLLALNSIIRPWLGDFQVRIEGEESYVAFRETLSKRLPTHQLNTVHGLRNIAMSISSDAAELGRRFMFISLFCYASGVAILLLDICYLIAHIQPSGAFDIVIAAKVSLGLVVSLLFYKRGWDFEYRALNTPFSVALAGILFEVEKSNAQKRERE